MNALPHHFINEFWRARITAFWRMMRQHVHENRDWAQNMWWMPVHATPTRVNWDNCHIENWDYRWSLDQTRRAPQWADLPCSYRQWWIYNQLPTNYTDLGFYLPWLNYEHDEFWRKLRQLRRCQNEWNNLSQETKMRFFDPVLPTAHVHAAKLPVGQSAPNPFKVSAYAIDTAVLPGREEQLHPRRH